MIQVGAGRCHISKSDRCQISSHHWAHGCTEPRRSRWVLKADRCLAIVVAATSAAIINLYSVLCLQMAPPLPPPAALQTRCGLPVQLWL